MNITDLAWIIVAGLIVGGAIVAAIHEHLEAKSQRAEDDDVHP